MSNNAFHEKCKQAYHHHHHGKNLSFNRRNKYGTHSYSGGKMHMHTSTTYLLGIHYHSYGIYLFISLKLLPS